uniref:CTNNB1_binding domain-containing protein n=1 Tax=Mesocestoides corti TaxID=53468 RepID=A0A5K3FFB4_MESCO
MSVGARDLSSGELSSCSSDDEERGAETYSFEVTEADEAAEDGVKLGNRKRPLKERLP